jgi:hypothetical protein
MTTTKTRPSPEAVLKRLREASEKRKALRVQETEAFDKMQDLAKEAKAQGATLRSIAEAGGISHVGVKYWLRER